MSKDKISDYSSTANSNTDIAGINIDEGCAPSGINDAIRTLMAQLKTWQSGGQDVYIHPAGSASAPSITANGDTNTGIFFPAADTVGITTGGSERARVDSSGNLGLGVTPSAWTSAFKVIDINTIGSIGASTSSLNLWANAYSDGSNWVYKTTAAATRYVQTAGQHQWFNAASGTAGNAISFTQAMTLGADGNLGIGTTSPTFADGKGIQLYNASGAARFRVTNNTTGSGTSDGAEFTVAGSDLYVINYEAANTIFWTNNTERARIDSSGNLLVGTTSTLNSSVLTAVKDVANNISVMKNTNASAPYGLQVLYSGADPNNTGSYYFEAYNSVASAYRFNVRSNGGISNYQANNVNLSDRREKTNFAPAKSYLDVICAIPVQTFNYIDQNMEEDPGLTLGVVAQDVQAVAPELVTESNWAKEGDEPKMRLSIYQTDLQYALMKALQELKAEFDAYKASHP